ncbi:MAG: glycosyltransferase [Kiritimatiellae bacterium]|nr:glycosyltransferase [Kiritimatiellia bacterium]
MRTPLFSCVVPVKGERPYFAEAIDSLRGQGLGEDLEIIVQDGDVEPDNGQSDALNRGFAKAKGEWLFWLNADDVLLPRALDKVTALMNRMNGLKWITGNSIYFNACGEIVEVRTDARWHSWFGKKLDVWTGGPSSFFRRDVWMEYGGADTDLKYVMDIDLWTRWAKKSIKFESVEAYIWGFREHDGSKTFSGRNSGALIKERAVVDVRHDVQSSGFWRYVNRCASVIDGTWLMRKLDTNRFKGKCWKEILV